LKKIILVASVAALAASVGGCNCGGQAPVVTSFGALPGVVAPGGTAVLAWVVTDADSLTIDNGVGVVSGTVIAVNPAQTTTYTLSATNKNGTTTAPATVTVDVTKPPLGMAGFKLTPATSNPVAGASTAFTVTAVDASGATVTKYQGRVHFTLTDASTQAVTPTDATFTPGDQGTKQVSATLITAGNAQLVAQDTKNAGFVGAASLNVIAAAPTKCTLSGLATQTRAGDPLAFRMAVVDAYDNVVTTGYAGTVSFTSSDGRASPPATFTFTAGDRGQHVFSAVFGTPGSQLLTATDATNAINCSGDPVEVSTGRASYILLSGIPSNSTAGQTNAFTMTAYDVYGNVATDFADTVNLTSTDPAGTFPASGAFSNGVASASVRLFTAGARQVIASDPSNSAITAQALVSVDPAAASVCAASGSPAGARAGDAVPLTVTLLDAFGNVAGGYTGTVSFTSPDARASLPSSFSFGVNDDGTHGFSVRFGTPGAQKVTVTDGASSISCDSGVVTVSNGPAVAFQIAGVPPTATAGATTPFTVTAVDSYGNLAADFTGTPSLFSTDPGGTFPVNGAFANGVAQASVRLTTAGKTSVFAVDPSNPALSTLALLVVDPAAASTCTAVGIPAAANAGDALPLRVTLLDPFGNVDTAYAGTLAFTSADTRATLPANYTFVSGDQGAHGFSVRFGTPGSEAVTVNDTASFITCTSGATTLSPGRASQFVISAMPSQAIAGAEQSFSATAQDSYGNLATTYSGPVTLSSTDPSATFPTSGAFSNGVATFGVAFQTVGGQTVVVTDTAAGFFGRGPPVAVHGLKYTAGGTGAEAFQLVLDPASSPAQVTLRLVAQAGATGYSAGFNIPADATRAQLVSITQGNALNPGSSPAALAASLSAAGPMANVLTAGISQKATDTTANATITAGQVLYTLVIKPNSITPGLIFDGARGGVRAAVRDFEGNELASQDDFAVGRLELQ